MGNSIDKQVHDELAKFAQQVADKYGIAIDCVSFEWVSTMAGDTRLINTRVTADKRK